jgi:phospholipase/carboxylesterase
MDLFVKRYQNKFNILSPRGHVPIGPLSFGWVKPIQGVFPDFADYSIAADTLMGNIIEWIGGTHQPGPTNIRIIGFSQGAALAYIMTLRFNQILKYAACLSGYLPEGLIIETSNQSMSDSHFFISHGIQDEIVPVIYARNAAEKLSGTGANVDYCEEAGGHKISLGCLKKLDEFINDDLSSTGYAEQTQKSSNNPEG